MKLNYKFKLFIGWKLLVIIIYYNCQFICQFFFFFFFYQKIILILRILNNKTISQQININFVPEVIKTKKLNYSFYYSFKLFYVFLPLSLCLRLDEITLSLFVHVYSYWNSSSDTCQSIYISIINFESAIVVLNQNNFRWSFFSVVLG